MPSTSPPVLASLLGPQKLQGVASPVAPSFREEGPSLYPQAYNQNAQFAKAGPYTTPLTQAGEEMFRSWVRNNRIPFNPNAPVSDYDMRGFFKSLLSGGRTRSPNGHFPDTYKTPYDTSFSAESKYANANNPFVWHGQHLIDSRNGKVVFG